MNKIFECLVIGEKFKFDASSTSKLEHAKIVYSDTFDYIGSSYTWFSDGIEQRSEELIHFFKRK